MPGAYEKKMHGERYEGFVSSITNCRNKLATKDFGGLLTFDVPNLLFKLGERSKKIVEEFCYAGGIELLCEILEARVRNPAVGDVQIIFKELSTLLGIEYDPFDGDIGVLPLLVYFLCERHKYYIDVNWASEELHLAERYIQAHLAVLGQGVQTKENERKTEGEDGANSGESSDATPDAVEKKLMVVPEAVRLAAVDTLYGALTTFPPHRVTEATAGVFTVDACRSLLQGLRSLPSLWDSAEGRRRLMQLVLSVAALGLGLVITCDLPVSQLVMTLSSTLIPNFRCPCSRCEFYRKLQKVARERDEFGVPKAAEAQRAICRSLIEAGVIEFVCEILEAIDLAERSRAKAEKESRNAAQVPLATTSASGSDTGLESVPKPMEAMGSDKETPKATPATIVDSVPTTQPHIPSAEDVETCLESTTASSIDAFGGTTTPPVTLTDKSADRPIGEVTDDSKASTEFPIQIFPEATAAGDEEEDEKEKRDFIIRCRLRPLEKYISDAPDMGAINIDSDYSLERGSNVDDDIIARRRDDQSKAFGTWIVWLCSFAYAETTGHSILTHSGSRLVVALLRSVSLLNFSASYNPKSVKFTPGLQTVLEAVCTLTLKTQGSELRQLLDRVVPTAEAILIRIAKDLCEICGPGALDWDTQLSEVAPLFAVLLLTVHRGYAKDDEGKGIHLTRRSPPSPLPSSTHALAIAACQSFCDGYGSKGSAIDDRLFLASLLSSMAVLTGCLEYERCPENRRRLVPIPPVTCGFMAPSGRQLLSHFDSLSAKEGCTFLRNIGSLLISRAEKASAMMMSSPVPPTFDLEINRVAMDESKTTDLSETEKRQASLQDDTSETATAAEVPSCPALEISGDVNP